jgi:pyruvate/2-oxoglutarate dehydrogenase complex dihydrolipoamide acyltransferase (E2) component
MEMKKTYEAGADNLTLTFPNARTGETVNIDEWPHSTEDPDEQRFLAGHPLVELSEEGERVQATPAAQTKAQDLGVDISKVEGSGAGGQITVSDVEAVNNEGGSE